MQTCSLCDTESCKQRTSGSGACYSTGLPGRLRMFQKGSKRNGRTLSRHPQPVGWFATQDFEQEVGRGGRHGRPPKSCAESPFFHVDRSPFFGEALLQQRGKPQLDLPKLSLFKSNGKPMVLENGCPLENGCFPSVFLGSFLENRKKHGICFMSSMNASTPCRSQTCALADASGEPKI